MAQLPDSMCMGERFHPQDFKPWASQWCTETSDWSLTANRSNAGRKL